MAESIESAGDDRVFPLQFAANLTFLFKDHENISEKYGAAKLAGKHLL